MTWRFKNSAIGLGAFLALGLSLVPAALAGPVDNWPSKPEGYLTDQAKLLDPAVERQLNGFLQELEQKTGVQFIVVTINSLDGLPKEDFSLALAEKWKLGHKGKDDGLLFVISKSDRVYRFETGYGLEGLLPDAFLGGVARERLVPFFKKGNYSEGLSLTVLTIISTIAKDRGVEISGMPKINSFSRRSRGNWADFGIWPILFLFLAGSAVSGMVRRRRYGVDRWRGGSGMFWGGMGGFGGFGGGGGGGGFGSFGGGGGGGFGGGGAGGSW